MRTINVNFNTHKQRHSLHLAFTQQAAISKPCYHIDGLHANVVQVLNCSRRTVKSFPQRSSEEMVLRQS